MPTFKSYLTGFISSICLTLLAFFAVTNHWVIGSTLIAAIFILAVTQLIIQLLFFLHLGRGSRANLAIFAGTLGIIFIIVAGSLWIMEKLNYSMTPGQVDQYMQDQGSF